MSNKQLNETQIKALIAIKKLKSAFIREIYADDKVKIGSYGRKVLVSLEKRGLIRVERRMGMMSLYMLTEAGKACLKGTGE